MFSAEHPLALIGCGNMGQALAIGWCRAYLSIDSFVVLDRNPQNRGSFYEALPCRHVSRLSELQKLSPAALCLATKPHQLDDVLADIKTSFANDNPLIISVAAGKMLSYYESSLWGCAAIIRAMPNTPSQVGAGMCGLIGNHHISPAQKDAVTALMDSVGASIWLQDEAQMHAVTAISGSGSAYVFYILECLVSAALKHGFSSQQARALAEQTVYGAAKMAKESNEDLAILRTNVTSPNGTTEAGLKTLMSSDIDSILHQTILSAKARSEEMSNS